MILKGKSVLITGASRGIGKAIAIECAIRGASAIILLSRSEADLKAVATQINTYGTQSYIFTVDLNDAENSRKVFQQIQQDNLNPDILVNNAGAGRWLYLDETSEDEIEQMMALPLLASIRITRFFLPGMMLRKSGYIAFVNSPASEVAWPGATVYATARAGLKAETTEHVQDHRSDDHHRGRSGRRGARGTENREG